MKKVFSILVALALLLGMSMVATPVLADEMSQATVDVGDPTVDTVSSYNITFSVGAGLAEHHHQISIQFPVDTGVPSSYAAGAVQVQGHDIAALEITGSNRVVTMYVPVSISAGETVTVFFKEDAKIKNPTGEGEYTLSVRTSKESWLTSKKYGIDLADYSTYEFSYARPTLISQGFPAEVDVTLKYKALGYEDYDQAWIEFDLDKGPTGGTVDISVKYEEDWYEYLNDTAFYPPSGTFVLKRDHNETINLRLKFSKVGVYTLSVRLMDALEPEPLLVDKPDFTCGGVSEKVSLNKGWNLVSLPIIPVNSNIEVVLADIMKEDDVKVKSVWYYNLSITDPTKRWQSYVPGGITPTLTKMEDGKAYWIDVKEDDLEFTFAGVAITLPHEVPPSYSVREGWNMIGFKSRDDMPVDEYLAGTSAVRVLEFRNNEWRSIRKDAPEEDDRVMKPGLGYWVAFSKAGIIYP